MLSDQYIVFCYSEQFIVNFVPCFLQFSFGLLCMALFVLNVPVNSKTAHFPPPPPLYGQTPGHLTFLKNFGQIPRYVASLDVQMPHPLELQKGSNSPPSRDVKATVKQVLQNFQPLRISCSTCLCSTL